jgi:NitT/TauT family transport system permease protein
MVKRVRRPLLINLGRVGLAALLILAWQLAVNHGLVDKFVASSPSKIWHQLSDWFSSGSIWAPLWATLKELFLGYGLGLAVGVALGMAIGISGTARAFFEPFLTFFNALPRQILTPIFIVLLGFGLLPKIVTVFCVIVIVITLTVSAGTQEIHGSLIDNARMLGARNHHLFQDVYLPGAGIWILSSARVAIALAFQTAIVAEFFGSAEGLGHLIQVNLTSLDATAMYSAILIAGLLAVVFDLTLAGLQRRAAIWLP